MLKIFKITFFVLLSCLYANAQNDILFPIKGKPVKGSLLEIDPFRITFQRIDKNNDYKAIFYSNKVYKVVCANGRTEIFNNCYHFEKNKTPEEYKTNLLPVRVVGARYHYGNHIIRRDNFFRTCKKLGDKKLKRLVNTFLTLEYSSCVIFLAGQYVFTTGYVLFSDTQSADRHDAPWFNANNYQTSYDTMLAGFTTALTGVCMMSVKRFIIRKKIIKKYNSLLIQKL